MNIDYKQSGVDIDAGNEAVRLIKDKVRTTFNSNVIVDIGTFGAMYDLSEIKKYQEPVLVQSIDGVGTKLKIGKMMEQYQTLGEDIVNHSCNDIVCQGAKPLTFLDYIAADKIVPNIISEIVTGMTKACQESKVSLIGGETAEMPGVYGVGEHDIAGCITGVVEKSKIVTGKNIVSRDVLLGLASSGLHTNGFSLARQIFFAENNYKANDDISELNGVLGEVLLAPHKNYCPLILDLLSKFELKGVAHITGGGLTENIPRVLPEGLGAEIKKDSWPVLPIFNLMQKLGNVIEQEMYRTFNMGIGMVLIVDSKIVRAIKDKVNEYHNYQIYEIGKIVVGKKEIMYL